MDDPLTSDKDFKCNKSHVTIQSSKGAANSDIMKLVKESIQNFNSER